VVLIGVAATMSVAQPVSGTVDLPDAAIDLDFGAERDAAIATRIRAALSALDGYSTVEVNVDAGVVTLTGSAVDEAAVDRLEQIVRRVEGVVAVNDRVAASTDLSERLAPIRDRSLHRMWQTISYLPLLTVAVLVFVLIYLVGVSVGRITRVWQSVAPNDFIAGIYAQLVRIVFVVLGLIAALDILGATALLGSILGAAGIIGLAIGFAVRDTVENFLASVMLSIRQPFRPFDTIEIEGDVGKVVRLTSRATILLSPDGNFIRVPNATVFKSRLVNFSRNAERRFTFNLDVDPGAEIAELRDALQAKLASLPFVLADPAPLVWLKEDTGDAVQLGFAGWIDQRSTNWDLSRGEAIRIVRAELAARNAAAPPPLSRVVNLDSQKDAKSAQHSAASADLDETTLPELSNREEQDLDRLVETERQEPQTRDLLANEAPKE
jgi:small-conductance mechanosensitive channel